MKNKPITAWMATLNGKLLPSMGAKTQGEIWQWLKEYETLPIGCPHKIGILELKKKGYSIVKVKIEEV